MALKLSISAAYAASTMALIDDAVLDVPVEDCSICACANIALIAFAGSFAPDALADAD
jgi:hypothetical protein